MGNVCRGRLCVGWNRLRKMEALMQGRSARFDQARGLVAFEEVEQRPQGAGHCAQGLF